MVTSIFLDAGYELLVLFKPISKSSVKTDILIKSVAKSSLLRENCRLITFFNFKVTSLVILEGNKFIVLSSPRLQDFLREGGGRFYHSEVIYLNENEERGRFYQKTFKSLIIHKLLNRFI